MKKEFHPHLQAMNLIQRLKNLWKLSEIEQSLYIKDIAEKIITQQEYEHKQPIIIKRTTPVDKFLNQDAK